MPSKKITTHFKDQVMQQLPQYGILYRCYNLYMIYAIIKKACDRSARSHGNSYIFYKVAERMTYN